MDSPACVFIENSFVLGFCIQRMAQIQRSVDLILCCLAVCLTFASFTKERKNKCKILFRICAWFCSHSSRYVSILPLFLSSPCVTVVEQCGSLLSLLYLYGAYVHIKVTQSLFSAYNCRSKHQFWQFSCPLCHLEGARWRQLAVRGVLGSIW